MLQEVLNGLANILGPIATLSKERRELKDSALRSISTALDETYLYYRDLDSGSKRNPEREAQLSRYWSAAAIPMRHFDERLAVTCDNKAQFWTDPLTYDKPRIKQLGIALDDVRQAYRKMLRPDFNKPFK